jgi:hypothetical protein
MRMNKPALLGAVVGASVSLCSFAQASTFSTPAGATDTAGDPVSASATITTGAGFVTISLSNNQPNMLDAGQLVSDLFFTLSGTTSLASPVYPGGVAQTQNSVDLPTKGSSAGTTSTQTVAWAATETSGQILLNGLGPGAIPTAQCNAGPACLVIGPPTTQNGTAVTYTNANGSLAGNGPHNPFIFETANFTIDVTGVTAATTISNVIFSFGTTAGDNVPGGLVPLPASIPLFGSGLAMLGWLGRRRKRSAAGVAAA